MALPVVYSFSGSDANPIGGNWTTVPTLSDIQRISNQGAGTGAAQNVAYWNADTPGTNQYCGGKFAAWGTVSGIFARLNTSTISGYLLYSQGTWIKLSRLDSGVETVLIDMFTTTLGATDLMELWCNGSDIAYYKNGVKQTSTTDTNYTTGVGAVFLFGTVGRITDFTLGEILPLNPYVVDKSVFRGVMRGMRCL